MRTLLRWIPTLLCLLLTLSAFAEQQRRKPKKKVNKDLVKVQKLAEEYLACAKEKKAECMEAILGKLKKHKQLSCEELVGHLETNKLHVHVGVGRALAGMKCEAGIEVALDLLQLPDWEHKAETAITFAASKDKRLLTPLMNLAEKGARPYHRESACKALAEMGMEDAVPALVKASGHAMFSVRLAAAQALAKFATPAARTRLCKMLESDDNAGVKVESAKALGTHKQMAAVPCLSKGLNDPVGLVQTASHEALKEATGLDLGLNPISWGQWYDKEINQR